MNENIDFIVLEHDDGAGCALIVATAEGEAGGKKL